MKVIIISGADGTGKTTIIKSLSQVYQREKLPVKVEWMRFKQFFSRLVNLLGRMCGKSYKENYGDLTIGYHDYDNSLLKVAYIITVYIDHVIFNLFFTVKNRFFSSKKILIIDRYLPDVMSDLIVDTNGSRLIFFLFSKRLIKLKKKCKCIILSCHHDKVVKRRSDIKFDKKHFEKEKAFNLISEKFSIQRIDTGENSVDQVVQEILKEE